jgi:hypothetical protein
MDFWNTGESIGKNCFSDTADFFNASPNNKNECNCAIRAALMLIDNLQHDSHEIQGIC